MAGIITKILSNSKRVSTAELLQKKDDPEMGLRVYKQNRMAVTDVTTKVGIKGSALSYGLVLGVSSLNEYLLVLTYVSE
jgi:hypothetical protein